MVLRYMRSAPASQALRRCYCSHVHSHLLATAPPPPPLHVDATRSQAVVERLHHELERLLRHHEVRVLARHRLAGTRAHVVCDRALDWHGPCKPPPRRTQSTSFCTRACHRVAAPRARCPPSPLPPVLTGHVSSLLPY